MKILFYSVLMILFVSGMVFSTVHAQQWTGTYTINGVKVKVTASHKNSEGQYADGHVDTSILARNYTRKALAASNKTFSYSNVSSCGNTTQYTIKVLSCTATKKCSKDGLYSESRGEDCKITRTQCGLCGCGLNGMCNSCGNTPTEDSCPDGVTIFPSDFVGPLPVNGKYTTKTEADCADRPTCSGPDCSGGGDFVEDDDSSEDNTGDGNTVGDDGGVLRCFYVTADGKYPPPSISFSASPKLISRGDPCTLQWEVQGAEACTIDNISVSPTNGTQTVRPIQTKLYEITCTNGPTSASASQLCRVQDVSEQ